MALASACVGGHFSENSADMKPAIEISFKLPFEINQFGDQFESSCPVLDVFSQGDNEEQAIENLKDALKLFLETALFQQSLSQVLLDCGFEPGIARISFICCSFPDTPNNVCRE